MPGKKDKKRKERSEGGDLASFLGGPMPNFNDEDLEAELLALTGGGSKSKKKASGGQMSLADINKMVASAQNIGEEEEEGEEEGSDVDEADLMAELENLSDDDDIDDPPSTSKPHPPVSTKPRPQAAAKPPSGSGDIQVVNDRIAMYNTAIAAAKSKGESSKVRRYERGLKLLNEMSRDLRAGKAIKMDDIPPEIASVTPADDKQPAAKQKVDDDDDLKELEQWAGIDAPPAKKPPPSIDTSVIDERLKMYQEGLKAAENANDTSKARRYKRSIDTLTSIQRDAHSGKPFNVDDLPPVIAVVATPTRAPPIVAPRPAPKPVGGNKPDNLIDLDDPEFDEFNLSEEDMAAMMGNFMDDRKQSSQPSVSVTPTVKATPPPTAAKPTVSKPVPPPVAPKTTPTKPPPSNRPPGLIDLDTPEFAEFDLTDEDLSILAAQMDSMSKNSLTTPPKEPTTRSLPAKLPQKPVGVSGGVTKEQVKLVLTERKEQYMSVMKSAKSKGDARGQKQYGTVAVQFERALKSLEQDTPIDLNGIPPPPPGCVSKYNYDVTQYKPASTGSTVSPTASATSSTVSSSVQQSSSDTGVDQSIPVPKTPLEALEQRLEKYKQGLKSAQEKGESSRVRRTNRIIKQYEDAIKLSKAGKPVDYDELPTPPGYPPIPAAPAKRTAPKPVQSLPASVPQMKLKASVNDKQVQLLKQRGAEFQKAAREAKAKGDTETALKYIRYFKGIGQMLSAAESGMPIDMTQVPASPYSDPSKATPSKGVLSHLSKAKEGDEETFDLIEKQLQEQLEMCTENAAIYEKLGNLGAASQYKNMADQCQRDLLAIKGIRSQGLTPPKFTMEMRKFALVHSNPGLSDKKIEVEIVRGITIPAPSGYAEEDLNIYVEIEFPWPQDSPQKDETGKVSGQSNPEFNSKHQFDIDRKLLRSLQRVFKRQPLKCIVYQHRTLRKNLFIGMCQVPLENLENKCEVRASEDLKDEKGRKATGGKLEVFVRLREPLSGCDQEEKEQKWLVFQESIAAEPTVNMLRPTVGGAVVSPIKVEQTTSMDALKLEFSIVQNALKAGKKDPATIQRGHAIQGKLQAVKQKLQRDASYKREYLTAIAREIKTERILEQQLLQSGRTSEAKIIQGRRKVMENEISKWQSGK